jgi:hypothetical protein
VSDSLIGVLIGGLVTSILAILGYWITFRTSTAANQEIANITKSTKTEELKKQSNALIAQFRMRWVDTLRNDVARYVRLHRHIELSRSKASGGKTPSSERENLLELLELRSRIRMMLKPDADEESERNLLQIIQQDVAKIDTEATEQREKIVEYARTVEKTEWVKAKNEISN